MVLFDANADANRDDIWQYWTDLSCLVESEDKPIYGLLRTPRYWADVATDN